MLANYRRRIRRLSGNDGFTLLEMMAVVGLIGVVMAMTIPVANSFIQLSKADSSIVHAMSAIDIARDRAVAERRNFVLTFIMPNRIQLGRQEIDATGTVTDTTTVDEFILENGQQFVKFVGVPDTPDAFGAATATSFTGTSPVMFTSDGSLVDSAGDIANGSIFLGVPGRPDTARAVTVFGMTGLTRAWKWRGSQWFE
jgi:prepilin-type N-terminal cleavage/methylation domain-containing protein